MVRCFVGFLLPEDVKSRIVEVQKEIEKWPMVCKLVERENLHLCFSFLGEIDENEVSKISKRLDFLSKMFKKVEVEVDGLKAIPSKSYFRVLVLGFLENDVLEKMSREIVKEIGGDSKPAHITLCRVKSVLNKDEVRKRIEEMNKKYGKLTINSIQLIKSELKKTGPVYSIVHQAELS
jgi:2'-5' RNA ligase